jgi:hypothetical protein
VVAGSLFGLFGLPVVFADMPDRASALTWLGISVLVCLGLLWPAPLLARSLANQLDRLPGKHEPWHDRLAVEVARLLLAAALLVVFQAVVRRPLVAAFGADVEPFVVEASLGALALLALLALAGGAYAVGRPLLERTMLVGLDALFATTHESRPSEPQRTVANPTVAAATVAAPRGLTTESTKTARFLRR